MRKTLTVICASTQLLLPLFSLGYPETATILVSHTLPSPRTLIALLARGLGEIKGLTSEQKVDISTSRKLRRQIEARLILQWAFESNSYAFSRPLSPIKKSSQIWRVVWIEKKFLLREDRREKGVPRDAVNVELVSLAKTSAYLFLDIKGVNESLRRYLPQVDSVTEKDVERALRIARIMGRSEMFVTPLSAEVSDRLNIVGSEGKINTYCPLDWLREPPLQGLVEDLLVHLRLLAKVEDPSDLPKHRREKLRFILPLSLERIVQAGRIVEYLKPVEIDVKVKGEYTIAETPDGGRVILPKEFLGVG
ncbi:MAG: hypothetical protein RMI04_09140 [Thermofilaceae archaeon]|nr:hypothetical protein [Thermofilaceae archaeon]